jgi:group I intron endonuclease
MTAGIYRIRNRVTGEAYIGSSVTVEYRVTGHIRALNDGRHENKPLQAAWSTHGSAAFSVGLLEVVGVDPIALADAEERWLRAAAGGVNGLYNIRMSGKSRGYYKVRPLIARLPPRSRGRPRKIQENI